MQSNSYIISRRGETPGGASVSEAPPHLHHPSPSGGRCRPIVPPCLLPPASSFSFNAGTHPDIQTLMRTGACRFSADVASFLPIVKSQRGVNGGNAPLKSAREQGKNGEGACGQQFGKRVSRGGEFSGRCCNLRSWCGNLGPSQHVGCASFNEHLKYPASPP